MADGSACFGGGGGGLLPHCADLNCDRMWQHAEAGRVWPPEVHFTQVRSALTFEPATPRSDSLTIFFSLSQIQIQPTGRILTALFFKTFLTSLACLTGSELAFKNTTNYTSMKLHRLRSASSQSCYVFSLPAIQPEQIPSA